MSQARKAVALAAVALLLSAALLPAFGDSGSGSGTGSGSAAERGGSSAREAGDGRFSLRELLRPLLGEQQRRPDDPPRRRQPPEQSPDQPQVRPIRGTPEEGSAGAIEALAEALRGILGPGNESANATLDAPDSARVYVVGDAVPGQEVQLVVLDGGGPVAGLPLYVNGKYVGTTGGRGTVRARVPYAAEMNVTTGPPPDERAESRRASPDSPDRKAGDGTAGADTSDSTGRPLLWVRPPIPLQQSGDGDNGSSGSENGSGTETVGQRVELPTDANLSVEGDPAPGATVTLVATVADRPFRGANVSVNGERAGRTGPEGRLEYTFGRVRFAEVTVERGAVSGGDRLAVQPVNLTLRGLAVPGQPVTARVSLRGEALSGVPVRFDGEHVGTTGADGEVRARVPVENRLVVAARTAAGVPVRRVVDWMLLPVVALPVALAALAGGGRYAHRRSERGVDGWLTLARARLERLAEAGLSLLVAGAGRLDALTGAVGRTLGRLAARIRPAVVLGVRGWPARLRELLAAARGRLGELFDRNGPTAAVTGGERAVAPAASGRADEGGEGGPAGPGERVRAAWRRLLRRAGIGRYRTLTPGEVRERALDADLSREAVDTLTEAFRAVEYGGADPRDLLAEVDEAAERLDGDDADGDGDGGERR